MESAVFIRLSRKVIKVGLKRISRQYINIVVSIAPTNAIIMTFIFPWSGWKKLIKAADARLQMPKVPNSSTARE